MIVFSRTRTFLEFTQGDQNIVRRNNKENHRLIQFWVNECLCARQQGESNSTSLLLCTWHHKRFGKFILKKKKLDLRRAINEAIKINTSLQILVHAIRGK